MKGCFTRLANLVFWLLLLVVLACAVLYFWLLPRVDELLADAVRREFMLPPSSTVLIDRGSLMDTLEGQVERFYVTSDEAKLDGVLVNDLVFEAKGIRFDLVQTLATGRAELKDVDYGELELKISEASLEERWAAELERRGLSKVEVLLEKDKVKVSGVIDLKLTKVRVAATGHLIADGSERIKFEPTEVDFGGANLQIKELNSTLSALTPVIDIGQFKMAILIDQLKAEDGYLWIYARSRGLTERMAEDDQARDDEKQRLAHEKAELEKQLEEVKQAEEEVKVAEAEADKKKESDAAPGPR